MVQTKLVSSNEIPMNQPGTSYRIFPLGDSAVTIDFGNVIDETINKQVLDRFYYLQQHPVPGMIEAAPAYSSLTVFYDVVAVKKKTPAGTTALDWIKKQLEDILQQPIPVNNAEERLVKIPVCFAHDLGPDLQWLVNTNKLSAEEVIQLFTARTYRVYMLGFLPGFSYMGEVDEKISIARKREPVNVQAGSIGIAGKQTGIYPLASPGGWQIIGRTPVKLFDNEKEDPVLLKAGDNVQFYSISRHEFENY